MGKPSKENIYVIPRRRYFRRLFKERDTLLSTPDERRFFSQTLSSNFGRLPSWSRQKQQEAVPKSVTSRTFELIRAMKVAPSVHPSVHLQLHSTRRRQLPSCQNSRMTRIENETSHSRSKQF
ncbi:hypothetical protein F2P81_018134 [Scophthalmus maximus]|uniref:Uncharacterized protein n=1 Tax=Scophthalmus maximus TaxID=52904 RepID=A0A6A4S901_SCOMX|nr:hypothetical protein F2P81_018134 [Scophthalmus maximus]